MFSVVACALAACQTTQVERNLRLVQERAVSLAPLSKWKATECKIEAHPTQPMLAVYRTMFPEDQIAEVMTYKWRAQKYNCDVQGLQDLQASRNQEGFVRDAMCTLLQTHWVNSPFEDLQIYPKDIKEEKDKRVHIESSMLDEQLGIYIDPAVFKLETKTKARGTLVAEYGENSEHSWLPSRLEHVTPKSRVVIDSIEYDSVKVNGRNQIKSLWISAGSQQGEVRRQTQLEFSDCRGF